MSLSIQRSIIEQFSFEGKSVRSICVKSVGECLIAGDVWRAVGYNRKAGVQAIQRYVPEKYKMRLGDAISELEGVYTQPNTVLLKEAGLRLFLTRCRKPEAVGFARFLGIDIENSLCMSKEQDTLSCITKAFKGEQMIDQYCVDGYRIDLYFPAFKLAIECDEFNHRNRDIGYEVTRQKHIEDKLKCQFIRYDPDADNFDPFEVVNRIYIYLKNYQN